MIEGCRLPTAQGRLAASALLVAIALSLVACSEEGSGSGSPASARPGAAADLPSSPPSPLAERLLGEDAIERFVRAGDELGLDWTILAAANQIETAGRGVPTGAEGDERVSAIGLTLAAVGAPADYEAALTTRGGKSFARRVLALAEKLRGSDDVDLPAASLPFGVPVAGQLVSGYGERFGALHDGIDIAAPAGQPVAAIAPGQVLSTGFDPAYGNRTCVVHRIGERKGESEDGRRLTTCYGNQARFEVEPGDVVRDGETIGIVGCSGPCLRPHVHLQILDGSAVSAAALDPAPFLDVDTNEIGTRFSLEEE